MARVKPREAATPITNPSYWMHLTTGWIWMEHRFHRGRVILRRVSPTGYWSEIRLYYTKDDPGTGAALLGAPYWIRTAKP